MIGAGVETTSNTLTTALYWSPPHELQHIILPY
jgi:cytochrome P450